MKLFANVGRMLTLIGLEVAIVMGWLLSIIFGKKTCAGIADFGIKTIGRIDRFAK
jgi:hypothetical protein